MIPEYVPGISKQEIARRYKTPNPIKLASNENPLGPSLLAIDAAKQAMENAHLYPDPDSHELRIAAAGFFSCKPDQVITGNGSDEILDLICRAYISPGDEVIIPGCTFSYYRIASLACGARIIDTAMTEHSIDIDSIEKAVNRNTKIVFIANPNNPTGTYIGMDDLIRLIEIIPKTALLVMDEAYAAFARSSDFMSAVSLINDHANIVTVHTLSKSHGLAGLRVGFATAGESIMKNLLRIKPPFNVNILAQKAGVAALSDRNFFNRTLENTWHGLDYFYSSLDELGLDYIRSHTNFVLIRIGQGAQNVYEGLLKRGIITRFMASYGMDEYIRVSVGLPHENEAFISNLSELLQENGL